MNQGPAKTKRYFTAAAENNLVDPSGAARLEDIRDFQNEIRLETIEGAENSIRTNFYETGSPRRRMK